MSAKSVRIGLVGCKGVREVESFQSSEVADRALG